MGVAGRAVTEGLGACDIGTTAEAFPCLSPFVLSLPRITVTAMATTVATHSNHILFFLCVAADDILSPFALFAPGRFSIFIKRCPAGLPAGPYVFLWF